MGHDLSPTMGQLHSTSPPQIMWEIGPLFLLACQPQLSVHSNQNCLVDSNIILQLPNFQQIRLQKEKSRVNF